MPHLWFCHPTLPHKLGEGGRAGGGDGQPLPPRHDQPGNLQALQTLREGGREGEEQGGSEGRREGRREGGREGEREGGRGTGRK